MKKATSGNGMREEDTLHDEGWRDSNNTDFDHHQNNHPSLPPVPRSQPGGQPTTLVSGQPASQPPGTSLPRLVCGSRALAGELVSRLLNITPVCQLPFTPTSLESVVLSRFVSKVSLFSLPHLTMSEIYLTFSEQE